MASYIEMLPRLQALQLVQLIDVLRFVTGRMEPAESRPFVADLQRQMNGGVTPRAPAASLEQLKAMGVQVVMEEVKDGGRS